MKNGLLKEILTAISFLINGVVDIVCFGIVGLSLLGLVDISERTLIIVCFFGIYCSMNMLYKMLSDKLSTPTKDGNG